MNGIESLKLPVFSISVGVLTNLLGEPGKRVKLGSTPLLATANVLRGKEGTSEIDIQSSLTIDFKTSFEVAIRIPVNGDKFSSSHVSLSQSQTTELKYSKIRWLRIIMKDAVNNLMDKFDFRSKDTIFAFTEGKCVIEKPATIRTTPTWRVNPTAPTSVKQDCKDITSRLTKYKLSSDGFCTVAKMDSAVRNNRIPLLASTSTYSEYLKCAKELVTLNKELDEYYTEALKGATEESTYDYFNKFNPLDALKIDSGMFFNLFFNFGESDDPWTLGFSPIAREIAKGVVVGPSFMFDSKFENLKSFNMGKFGIVDTFNAIKNNGFYSDTDTNKDKVVMSATAKYVYPIL